MVNMKMIKTCMILAALAAGTVWGDAARGEDRGRFATMDGALAVEPGGLTFAGALERIRGLRAKGESAPVRVRVRGVNRIRETLVFGPEDHDIEFVGEDGAVLSGGVALSGWKDVGDGVWEAEAPRAADGRHLSFDQLWVNGRRAARARYPDEGYLRICAKGIRAVTNGEGRVTYVERVKAADGRFGEFAKLTADELSEAQLCVVHKWSFARRILRGFADGMVETHSPADWNGWQTWSTNETLVAFENVPFAFDAAGEWLSDMRSGRIRYRPLPGERMESLEAVVPVPGLSRLVDFRGRCDGGKIRNVSFRNISFLHSAATRDSSRAILDEHPGVFCAVPDDGRTESWQHQAASGSDGAITLQGAAGVSFENCTVAHTGNYAFRLNDGCVSNAIVSCALRDLGAGGVWMGEGFRYQDMRGKFSRRIIRPDRPESTAFNLVSNCTIVCGGRYNPEGTGVAVTHCSDSRIVHNDIGDFYYTGVSVGWTWGYSGSVAQRNEIGWNRIWDLGKRVMSDMGGVYTLATSFGTRVHHNIIHDVWGYTYGGWALYTDEGSEGIVMEDNICWNTTDGGFHQHYGVGCIIRNNVFAFNRERGAVRATRTEKDGVPCSLHFVNNIVAVDHGPLVCANARKVEGVWANNLWYDYRGKDAAVFGGLKWDEWVRAGKESGSRFADPKFRNPRAFDFTLEADSPAFQLGFRPFSLATAGAVKQKTGGGKR